MADLIELERVSFREMIDVPGKVIDGVVHYPTREGIVVNTATPNKRLTKNQHFNLWLDTAGGFVIVEHPESLIREEVPLHNVRQWRRRRTSASTATTIAVKKSA
jgi:hypothetical protein